MNSNWKKQIGLLLIIVVIAGLLAMVTGGDVAYAKKHRPPVLPPQSSAFGQTYGEWAAEWWTWAFKLPATSNHPLVANGEMDCSMGQNGKVWFLGGSTEGVELPSGVILADADRECEVPVGKAIFFPVVNIVCSEMDGDGTTEEELSGCANYVIDHYVYPLSATIDGVEIDDLEAYRTVSPLFYVEPLPDPAIFGYEPGSHGAAVSSGYYLLLPPLSKGKHDIKFEGEIIVPEWNYHFKLDITYVVTAVPGKYRLTRESIVDSIE